MKFLDYAGETIALILAPPNWAAARPRLTATLPFTSIDEATSGRETRRNYGRSNRYLLEYTPRFSGAAAATEFRSGLNRLIEETVAVPLWLDSIIISSPVSIGHTTINKTSVMPARYGAEWIILPPPGSGDGDTYEIVTVTAVASGTLTIAAPGAALAWPAGTLMYPLLFGRFDPRPSLKSVKPQTVEGGLQIRENSSYARRLNAIAGSIPAVGAGVPAFSTTPLWNMEPTWSQVLDTTEIDILYEQLGFLRQEQSYTAQQTVRRGLEMEFVCNSRSAIAALERFFADRRGPTRPFMVPTFRADLVPTADLPLPDPDTIEIADSEYSNPDRPVHPGDPYVAFVEPFSILDPLAARVFPYKLSGVLDNILGTVIDVAEPHLARTTRLSFLLLARFAEPQLPWEYQTPHRATARLKFLEVADEYVTPNTEEEPAYLYKFQELMPVPLVQFFTSYENSIEWDGDTWTPAPFSHATTPNDLNLKDEVTLTSWGGNFPANPLGKFWPYTLEGRLFCDIVRVNAADPGDASAKIRFAGYVTKPDFTGRDWKATVRWLQFLDRNVPRVKFEKVCQTHLYSAKCGLLKADFATAGTITDLDDTVIEVTCDAPEIPLDNGFLETGAGSLHEKRPILHAEAIAGGQRLVLDRALNKAVLAQAINMYPGCNYSGEMCDELYGNIENFRGFRYIPIKNPSANIGELTHNAEGKKG